MSAKIKHYQFRPPRDDAGYYTIELDDDGLWRWYWWDSTEDGDFSAQGFHTRAEALRDAADDIEGVGDDAAGAKRLAARLRLAAAKQRAMSR